MLDILVPAIAIVIAWAIVHRIKIVNNAYLAASGQKAFPQNDSWLRHSAIILNWLVFITLILTLFYNHGIVYIFLPAMVYTNLWVFGRLPKAGIGVRLIAFILNLIWLVLNLISAWGAYSKSQWGVGLLLFTLLNFASSLCSLIEIWRSWVRKG